MTAIVPMGPESRSYVLDSWRRSMPKKMRRRRGQTSAHADRQRARLVDSQSVLVASGNDGAIFGWICFTPLRSTAVVHYIYVRDVFRTGPFGGQKFGRALLGAAGVDLSTPIPTTLTTPAARAIAQAKGLRLLEVDASEVLT